MKELWEKIDRFSVFDWAPTPLAAIVWRELLTTLRQRRYGVILLGAAGIILYINLQNLGQMAFWTISPAMAVSNVLRVQYSALLAFIFLVIPALAAVTLAAERMQETEDLLFTALFRPVTLVFGKLVAVIAVFAAFHIALLPLAAFIYFFAGIEIRSFFQIQLVLYASAFFHTLIGVTVSRVVHAPNRAVLLSYLLVAGLYAVPSGLHVLAVAQALPGAGFRPDPPPNPILLVPDLLASRADWGACGSLLIFQTIGTLLIGALCAGGAAIHWGTSAAWQSAARKHLPPRRNFGPIPNWGNPVYHKDRRTIPAARWPWAVIVFVLTTAGAWCFTAWSARELEFAVTGIHATCIVLYVLAPFQVIGTCNYELAPNVLVMLRLSRLGSDRVLSGKALAILHVFAPAMLGAIAGTGACVIWYGLPSLNAGPGAGQSFYTLVHQGIAIAPKTLLAIAVCFLFCRFRAPGAADLATNLALTGVFLTLAEAISQGFFESILRPDLGLAGATIVTVGHVISLLFTTIIVFSVAQMRFETVFDEGSDIYAISHIDRRNF